MKLYSEKLNNLKDLEREKRQLKKELRDLEEEDFFSLSSLLGGTDDSGKGKNKKEKGQEASGGIMDMLPMLSPVIGMVWPLIQSRLVARPAKNAAKTANTEERPARNVIKKVAIEIITGYLKWKAIELSYKGIKVIIKKQKEKKAIAAMEHQTQSQREA